MTKDRILNFLDYQKIAVVGNAAGGKTQLSRKLGKNLNIPVTHVDSIQFLPGLKINDLKITREKLLEIESKDQWIIDGYGPLDLIENRFKKSDLVIFIDLPFQTHVWWFIRRQIKSLFWRRPELVSGCNEFNYQHSLKVYRTMKKMNEQMRPELLKIFAREIFRNKVLHIVSIKQLNSVAIYPAKDL